MKKIVIAISGIATFMMFVFWICVNLIANDDWIIKSGKTILISNIIVLIVQLVISDHMLGLSFIEKGKNSDYAPTVDMIVYGSAFLNFVLTLIWSIVRHMFYFSNQECASEIVNMREFYSPWIALANHIFAVGHYAAFHSLNSQKHLKNLR